MTDNLLAHQREFLTTFRQNITTLLAPDASETAALRIDLIAEELEELLEAFEQLENCYATIGLDGDPSLHEEIAAEEVFKEYGDLVYVVMGLGAAFQLPVAQICAEVHKSNMSKVHPNGEIKYRKDGKVLKPESYTPANMSDLVERYFEQNDK